VKIYPLSDEDTNLEELICEEIDAMDVVQKNVI